VTNSRLWSFNPTKSALKLLRPHLFIQSYETPGKLARYPSKPTAARSAHFFSSIPSSEEVWATFEVLEVAHSASDRFSARASDDLDEASDNLAECLTLCRDTSP